jgi:WD40 repeat protein
MAVSSSLGGRVIVWDVTTGKPMRRFVGHSQAVTDICLARGGQTVISVSADLTMREWRIDATHEALVAWIQGNRYVPELTGEERAAYQVDLLGEAEATTTGAE